MEHRTSQHRLIGVVAGVATLGLNGGTAGATTPPPADPTDAFTFWSAAIGVPLTSVACNVEEVTTCYGLNASMTTVTATMNPDGSFTYVTPTAAASATPATTAPVVAAPSTVAPLQPSAEVGTRDNPVPIGVPADMGDGWTVTVNSVDLNANEELVGGSMFNDEPPAGSVYILINVTATYNGSDDKATPFMYMSGVTSSNLEIDGLDNFVLAPDSFDSISDVFAGGSETGDFALTVPIAELDSLVLYTNLGFIGDDVFFSAH